MAFKAKQQAGTFPPYVWQTTCIPLLPRLSLVGGELQPGLRYLRTNADDDTDKKAREEMAKKAGGKGPMNTGQQGIKKSGKK